MSARSYPPPARRGAIALAQALLLSASSLLLAVAPDWYVDANAPGCSAGTGTEADPFCAIMDAVAAAADGDTIHIAPGTYFENVLLDKDLTLIGTGGQTVTILDGMASGSVVRVETDTATLIGLTLTNGTGTTGAGTYLPGNYGGGLFVYDGDQGAPQVALDDCNVSGNAAGVGGGIFIRGGLLALTSSTVSSNSATGHYAVGGGIRAREAIVGNSTIVENSCYGSGTYASASGGGIAASFLTLESSAVIANTCSSSGYAASAEGGGILAGYATISNSTVSGNACQDSDSGGSNYNESVGGGLRAFVGGTISDSTVGENRCSSPEGTAMGGGLAAGYLLLTGSKVLGNEAEGASARGGGIVGRPSGGSGCPGTPVISLVNAIVSGNSALGTSAAHGGGIDNRGPVTVTNSTVVGNSAMGALALGGALHLRSSASQFELANSVVWGNGASPIALSFESGLCGGTPSGVVEYSLVEGGWPGVGNIDADPLFRGAARGDYRLLDDSPCIDAGKNSAVPPGTFHDLRGAPRFWNDPFTPDTGAGPAPVVDLGALEFFRKVRRR